MMGLSVTPLAEAADISVVNYEIVHAHRDFVPLFECPDKDIEKVYYFRWWTFRKHIKQTPAGIIVTEFIEPVRHAGTHNSISCALGHHLAEGRWIRNQSYLDEYTRYWFFGNDGQPDAKFHNYSSWFAAAVRDRFGWQVGAYFFPGSTKVFACVQVRQKIIVAVTV